LSDPLADRYTETITPSDNKPKDYLLILAVGLVFLVAGWLVAWSNHFQSSFHFNDFPAIVSNGSVHSLANFARFFGNPRISSIERDSVAYKPLLEAWFAFDYQFLGGANPFTFQAENFVWFTSLLLVMFLLFRLVPGVNGYAAGFATLLFGLHPVVADTVNYAHQRGVIMGAFGVVCGLMIFAYWPWHLPQTFPLKLKRVPEHGFDEYLRKNYQTLEQSYLGLIHLPLGVYLWPVVPALLCDASTAVFAPILGVYIILFETRRTLRNAIPATAICAAWWIFQLAFTWQFVPFSKTPPANYWFSQPWVAIRFLIKFFVPVHLSVDTDFHGFAHFWDPLAIAGYVGVAALIFVALALSKREKWRPVAFGLWWFLIALMPEAIVRQGAVEANWRMFLPFAGLALAVAGAVSIAMEAWLPKSAAETETTSLTRQQLAASAGAITVAVGLLAVLGWATHERNQIWESEASLWQNAMEASPGNGRAIMYYGLTRQNDRDITLPLTYMKRADAVSPGDPLIEVTLARAYARLTRNGEAEGSFENAIGYGKSYSPAWSAYGQWLFGEGRIQQASDKATRAVQLDPYDMAGRRTLMDILGQRHQWSKLKEFGEETLRLLPNDPDGERSLLVAQTGLDQFNQAVTLATSEPTVDHYLALSVQFYEQGRYQDCIDAARQALKLNPNLGEAWANIASAYHTMGDIDQTIAALQEEIRLNPDLPSARSNLAIELAVKKGEHKD
jgi:protein O-mannosyl-transferase